MIIIPGGIHVPELDPDKEAEKRYNPATDSIAAPRQPICQRCQREQDPPYRVIMATERKVWNTHDPNRLARQFDIICSDCREAMKR